MITHPILRTVDLYELTMAQAYWKQGLEELQAAFHVTCRRLPFRGGYAVCAGLGPLIEKLQGFRFHPEDLAPLADIPNAVSAPLFEPRFLEYLGRLRFRCQLYAVDEGTLVFEGEPMLRIEGPIIQAQLLETVVLNTLGFQSLIATKAARICLSAGKDEVIDFGLRRAQGPDGGLSASRAAYLGGCSGTSNVAAGLTYRIPLRGTHAHSWVMAFDDERQAFQAFAESMPDQCLLLVDTYGSEQGIPHAVAVLQDLKRRGHTPLGIRIDSGDLHYFSRQARRALDAAGLPEAKVMASSELDEYLIRSLKQQGASVDIWGVGTKLVTAWDDPACSVVYKLSAVQRRASAESPEEPWQPRLKISDQKAKISIPGRLQVYRCIDSRGRFAGDIIADESEDAGKIERLIDPHDNTRQAPVPAGIRREPLLKPVFVAGEPVVASPSLLAIREHCLQQLTQLDASHKRLENPHVYRVGITPYLNERRDAMILEYRTAPSRGPQRAQDEETQVNGRDRDAKKHDANE